MGENEKVKINAFGFLQADYYHLIADKILKIQTEFKKRKEQKQKEEEVGGNGHEKSEKNLPLFSLKSPDRESQYGISLSLFQATTNGKSI